MKKISQQLLSALLLVTVLWSCKKDEQRVIFEKGTAPVLTSSVLASIPLEYLSSGNEALKLLWTNPQYQLNTGVSSYDVSYQVEIDTAGSNFTNPDKKIISVSKDLSISVTQNDFNDYLLNQLKLAPGISHNVEIRVKSFLIGGAGALYSNTLKFTGTPYSIPPKVASPAKDSLWLTGDATNSGYANPLGTPYDVNQRFTKVSNTLYELIVNMKGGGGYKLIQKQGEWSSQYHMITGGTWQSGDFEKKDAEPAFPGPPSSGSYKVSIDFQRGKYSVTKL